MMKDEIREILERNITCPHNGKQVCNCETEAKITALLELVISKIPKENEVYINNKVKPTIAELENIIKDKGYEIMPNGEIRSIDKEAIGFNACIAELKKNIGEDI